MTSQSPANIHAGSGSIFDSKQKFKLPNMRAFEIGGRNPAGDDLAHIKQTQMLPQFSTMDASHMRSDISVDIISPEAANPMDRIKARNAEKKNEKLKKKRQMEDLLEKSKNEVLGEYKIKSML